MREVLEATETKTHELSTALAKALNAARESQASDLKTSRALATALAERDAARAERDARKVALDGFADAARDADSRCVALLADLKKAQNDASRAKAALEERARIARGADDAAARAAEETRRFKSENATLASRLARVAAATRAVDDAAAHVRAVARGDASPENDDDAGDEGNKGDVSGFDRDAAAERRNVESVVAFPASLAESLGNPSRVPRSPRRHAAAAADEDAPSTEPGGDPFAESAPASAEAAPVTSGRCRRGAPATAPRMCTSAHGCRPMAPAISADKYVNSSLDHHLLPCARALHLHTLGPHMVGGGVGVLSRVGAAVGVEVDVVPGKVGHVVVERALVHENAQMPVVPRTPA